MKEFKNLKFQSVIPQDILQAVSLLEEIGYEVGWDFSADDAARHNGLCAWDDGEITEGWLDDYSFEQVTLDDLKDMSGMVERCESFMVSWEKVFGENFVDSVSKAVKQYKTNIVKKDNFTLELLIGCEVLFHGNVYWVNDIYCINQDCHLFLENDYRRAYASHFNLLTFFTEDGDELTFDEYVQLYYPKG